MHSIPTCHAYRSNCAQSCVSFQVVDIPSHGFLSHRDLPSSFLFYHILWWVCIYTILQQVARGVLEPHGSPIRTTPTLRASAWRWDCNSFRQVHANSTVALCVRFEYWAFGFADRIYKNGFGRQRRTWQARKRRPQRTLTQLLVPVYYSVSMPDEAAYVGITPTEWTLFMYLQKAITWAQRPEDHLHVACTVQQARRLITMVKLEKKCKKD